MFCVYWVVEVLLPAQSGGNYKARYNHAYTYKHGYINTGISYKHPDLIKDGLRGSLDVQGLSCWLNHLPVMLFK